MNKFILNGLNGLAMKYAGKLKKYTPEILVTAGIITGIATVVLTSRETMKAQEILDEHIEKAETIKAKRAGGQDTKKETVRLYLNTAGKLAKNYAPAIATGSLSLTCTLGSFGILRKRNIGLIAAYNALGESFAAYQGRVAEKFGAQEELDIRTGAQKEIIEKIETDKKGKEKKVEEEIKVFDEAGHHSKWARFFDQSCNGFRNDPELNKSTLISIQNRLNDLLGARSLNEGVVFINELFVELGLPLSKEGWKWGWDKRDFNRIDLGLDDGYRKCTREFVNGYEAVFMIEPNCHYLPDWA